MADSKISISLKLLIDTKGQKVLFAEAGKDFVDFLFNLLSLPLGTVIRLFKKQTIVGCLGNIHESIENLSNAYMQPNQNKESLLKPKSPICAAGIPLLLSDDSVSTATRKAYLCTSCCGWVADNARVVCPSCRQYMSSEVQYVAKKATMDASAGEGGYVKGLVTYMVMDDLEVKPMSTISCITLLNKFNVKDVGALEERVVDFSITEGLKLLKASLQSKTVLTSVFLGSTGA